MKLNWKELLIHLVSMIYIIWFWMYVSGKYIFEGSVLGRLKCITFKKEKEHNEDLVQNYCNYLILYKKLQ